MPAAVEEADFASCCVKLGNGPQSRHCHLWRPDWSKQHPVEFLHSITHSGKPPHRLNPKEGAIVKLLRNLDIRKGLRNGTHLILRHLHSHVLDAEILTGIKVFILRIKLAPSDAKVPFILQRIQFPIRLSYSIKIQKPQGQTCDETEFYLASPVISLMANCMLLFQGPLLSNMFV